MLSKVGGSKNIYKSGVGNLEGLSIEGELNLKDTLHWREILIQGKDQKMIEYHGVASLI